MKQVKTFLSLSFILFVIVQPTWGQKTKYLNKSDDQYAQGNYAKSLKYLNKYKVSLAKLGTINPFLSEYYVRSAKINLAQGTFEHFDSDLKNAVQASLQASGDTSFAYAKTLLDIVDIYNEYGYYRLSHTYVDTAKMILEKSDKLTGELSIRVTLSESEALIGQGFFNSALEKLRGIEDELLKRAVDKETYVDNGNIKTRKVPSDQLELRCAQYAQLLTLKMVAYGRKGRISFFGDDQENLDKAYLTLESWLKGKSKYLGDNDLSEVRYRYLYVLINKENQGVFEDSELKFNRIISDLKKQTNPSNSLAQDVYLLYLEDLLKDGSRVKFNSVKGEYQKVVNKYFPKNSIHRLNIDAVEFNAKLSREKTKDLEKNALQILNSKSLPKNYKTTERILRFLYDVAISQKRYAKAEEYLDQLTSIKKELCGDTSPEYHLAKIKQANFYLDYTNKLEEAGKIYENSYFSLVAHEIEVQHRDMLSILNHIAIWYELTDRYKQSLEVLEQAKNCIRTKFRNDDILFGIELNHIAKLELKLGEYELAEADINKAIEVIQLKHNREYVEYVSAYVNVLETQATLYGIKGLFDEAEKNLDQTRKIISKSVIPVNTELSTVEELTNLFIQLGRYAETDKLLIQVFSEYEKLYGKNSIRLIGPLVNRSQIQLVRGEYTDAEKNARRANEIAINAFGENSTKTAPTQKILSDIYYKLGDYERAEENITKALNSQEKQFGRKHIEVAKSMSQLALIKFHKGDDKKDVEKLMLESRDIMAAKLGTQNPQYAEILKNVAILYISQGNYEHAFNSLNAAEKIWQAKTGRKNNINTASISTLKGDVFYQQKNYDKAERFYEVAEKLYTRFFSEHHPEYVSILSKLSKVHYMKKEYKASKKLIEEALSNYEMYIKTYFPALSEGQKAKYWNTIKGDFEFYNTLAFSNLEDFRDLTGKVYDYQLLTKALLLSSSIKIRERILNSADEALKSLYGEWIEKKELLTLSLSMTNEQLVENEINPSAIQQEVERIEKELSQKSELFGQSFENKKITYQLVSKSLNKNEVALEIVRYRYFNHSFTDSIIYVALYLKEGGKPKAIILGDGKNMENRYFKYYRNAITGRVYDKYSYDVFWGPIQKELGLAASIYLSADGVYNQINLEAIPTPDQKYIIDNANIVLVSNTRDLYIHKVKSRQKSNSKTASMFGNPTFYVSASDHQVIPSLPGTEKEVNALDLLLKEKGWVTDEYVEGVASEEQIKSLSNPNILHIATHGLYRPSEEITLQEQMEGDENKLSKNPLLRTGLLLKGGGDLLQKSDYNYNIDNGILTAYEAMNLNLDKTDMVVLSACETGLGDVEQGEGVYGLQRAFLVAGAKTLIMSMFKVDDEATQKLMIKFYKKFIDSGNLRDSFTGAKKELRTEYPDPIYWGAFIMIGLE